MELNVSPKWNHATASVSFVWQIAEIFPFFPKAIIVLSMSPWCVNYVRLFFLGLDYSCDLYNKAGEAHWYSVLLQIYLYFGFGENMKKHNPSSIVQLVWQRQILNNTFTHACFLLLIFLSLLFSVCFHILPHCYPPQIFTLLFPPLYSPPFIKCLLSPSLNPVDQLFLH